jgi:hypothetical protein
LVWTIRDPGKIRVNNGLYAKVSFWEVMSNDS